MSEGVTTTTPSTAIEFQRARLRVGKTAFTSTTMWRMFAARTGGPWAFGEESAQGARSCDLEGNRAGLGCLEHLRNALSFAVVTEWPGSECNHVAVDGHHLMPV